MQDKSKIIGSVVIAITILLIIFGLGYAIVRVNRTVVEVQGQIAQIVKVINGDDTSIGLLEAASGGYQASMYLNKGVSIGAFPYLTATSTAQSVKK